VAFFTSKLNEETKCEFRHKLFHTLIPLNFTESGLNNKYAVEFSQYSESQEVFVCYCHANVYFLQGILIKYFWKGE